ncbi:MAG: hypothetical protein KKC18_14770, partial [Chloroflexi bacterium]|nr:hypothetical protein [Chloroflexota bacterium]
MQERACRFLDEKKRKTGTSLAGVGLASLGLKTSGCDFSQPPVEATETPEEATPTSEQEAQPVIEPGTFSLQQEEGVIKLEGTRSDTGERLRLVAL